MTAQNSLHTCYELQGESLQAVQTYVAEVARAIRVEKQRDGGPQWDGFYARTYAALNASHPDLLEKLGLKSPSTVIKGSAGEFPRTYLSYAQIFVSPHQPPRYYMYVPHDHAGNAFVPEGAKELTPEERDSVDSMLFAGGWITTPSLIALPDQGIAPPADVAAKSVQLSFTKAASQYLPAEADFIATGRALEIVRDYKATLGEYNGAMKRAFDALRQAAETLFPAILKDYPAGEGLYVNLGGAGQIAEGANTCLTISIRRDGKGGDFMAGGQPVSIPDNPHFMLAPHRGGDYAVIMRDDTPQGRRLAKVLRAVSPSRPSLADYPELAVNGISPALVEQGHYKILRYFIKDETQAVTPPPGAIAFPPAALAWLRADDEDRQLGRVPPPMPQALAAYLLKPLGAGGSNDSKSKAVNAPKKPLK